MIADAWDSIKTETLKQAWGKLLHQTVNVQYINLILNIKILELKKNRY